MPMVNIERAIKRVTDKAAAALNEVLYEGYGPAGVAVLVECATDNTNRTYPEIRLIFSKTGGNIAEMGAVAFQFKHRGVIKIAGSGDELMLEALDAGAEDVNEEIPGELVVYTELKDLGKVRDALKTAGHKILEAELIYDPQNKIEISDESSAEKVMKLLDALEEHQDVVNVYSNFEMV
jgi:YebC/PmpR family DNA-binding regulatory protein